MKLNKLKILLLIPLLSLSFSFSNDPLSSFVDNWLGVPYVYGGTTKRGIDCSAFTQRLYKEVYDIRLPRTAAQQYKAVTKVSKDELQRGDLLFFRSRISPSGWHCGVYIGDGQFVHASNRKDDVKISNLNDEPYSKSFKGAGRMY